MNSRMTYLNDFIRTRCAPDLLMWNLFPNVKEITESMGAYRAVTKHLHQYDLKDPGVTVIVVGDGKTPRTGALFACRSNWTVYSVDPIMNPNKTWPIRRLNLVVDKIENFEKTFDRVIIIGVHSHATVKAMLNSIKGKNDRSLILIPCCVPQHISGKEPDKNYSDAMILSPKRRVNVYYRV